MKICNMIKEARKQLGLFFMNRRKEMGHSLNELAEYLGISANTLHGIETGRFAWDIDLHLRICQALEIKPYFSVTLPPDEQDYTLRKDDDPARYHGYYLADNELLYPGQIAVIKLSDPRVFVRIMDTTFMNYEDFKNNVTDIQFLDPPGDPETKEYILIDVYNFITLTDRYYEDKDI